MLSRLSPKGQVTIPKKVREQLGLAPNDYIIYEIQEGVAVLRKLEPFDAQYHAALSGTLSEWSSAADEEAFRDL
jgi:AbrB family looped-hinge helix DNA binding protein